MWERDKQNKNGRINQPKPPSLTYSKRTKNVRRLLIQVSHYSKATFRTKYEMMSRDTSIKAVKKKKEKEMFHHRYNPNGFFQNTRGIRHRSMEGLWHICRRRLFRIVLIDFSHKGENAIDRGGWKKISRIQSKVKVTMKCKKNKKKLHNFLFLIP